MLLLLGLVACGGQSTTNDGGNQDGVVDATAACGGCGSDQVCVGGACTDVPQQCPCPVETYCDLATQACTIGCTEDDECDVGRYCDIAARTCRPGCRSVADCPSPAHGSTTCTAHTCETSCDDQFHACGTSCEADDAVDACGDACVVCPQPAHTLAACSAGQCAAPCASGWGDCNADPADGCEASTVSCYQDQDEDGYVASLTPEAMCACPQGWTSTPSQVADCDDNDLRAFPGQTKFFTTARHSGGYDYDCDGNEQLLIPISTQQCYGYSPSGCNPSQGWAYYAGVAWFIPPCGQVGVLADCTHDVGLGRCSGPYTGDTFATQSCR